MRHHPTFCSSTYAVPEGMYRNPKTCVHKKLAPAMLWLALASVIFLGVATWDRFKFYVIASKLRMGTA